jgi:hypothetical protein
MGPCGPRPPNADDAAATTDMNTPVMITLPADDDGLPEPATLNFIITALPASGTLRDPGAGAISSVPYTLTGAGNQVEYTPTPWLFGADSFQFKASDGGTPPEGGDSNIATISITVNPPGPQPIHSEALSSDPGWTTEGQWAFGQPTGGGSFNGDPTSGHTGDFVYGYNLGGDYDNNMPVYYLTSTPFDCTGLTNTQLRLRRWLGVEFRPNDHAVIHVSADAVTWTVAWRHGGGTISDSSWSSMTYDISAVADGEASVYFRWGMGPTNGTVTYPGWNIDDVEIWGAIPPCVTMVGDVNLDGIIDGRDLGPFVDVLLDPGSAPIQQQCAADVEVDGVVDMQDVDAFVQTVLNP